MPITSEGTYEVRTTRPQSGWSGVSSKKGTPYIQIDLIVEAGEAKGSKVRWTGYLSDNAIEKTLKTLNEIFGWKWNADELEFEEVPFDGVIVTAEVVSEEYNGKTFYKAKWINAIRDEQKTDPKKLRSALQGINKLAIEMSKQICIEVPHDEPRPDRNVKASDPIELADDDIPF
jgi:hypothetical protein